MRRVWDVMAWVRMEVWRVRGRPLCRRNDADMFGVEMKLDLVQRGDLWLLSKYGVLERGA
jgi:hypothetical protein